ncbi:hypothetical protein L7F22_036938 [Adiantum nelumboides]|nr:hypothetical protein [Adiantum nelumboides]
MPVSWDMASGPIVACKMAGQGSTCVAVDGTKGSNFSNFRMQDAISRGFSPSGEPLKGSHYRFTASHDTVMRGLSALSLRGQFQLDADTSVEDCRTGSLGAICSVRPESCRPMSSNYDESSPFSLVPSSVCGKHLGLGRPACNVGFVQPNGMHSKTTVDESESDSLPHLDVPQWATLNAANHVIMPNGSHRVDGFDLDTMSESLFSSETCMPAISSSSGEASQVSDETEIQSALKEGGGLPCFVGSSTSSRKGLSQFYAGKSRSFSGLRDVVSVKDLAKPESPYAKKRKVTSSSSRLPPLQKGPAAISKKSLQSGKSTLALAVAMSTKEENELQLSRATPTYQHSLVPSRSYSLSDLQGAGGSLFFIG